MKLIIAIIFTLGIINLEAKDELIEKVTEVTSLIRDKQKKLNRYQKARINKLLTDVVSTVNGDIVTLSDGPYKVPDISKVIVCTSIRDLTNLYTGVTYKTQDPCASILPKINKLGVYCSEAFVATSVMSGIKMKTQTSCVSSISTMNDYGAFCTGPFELTHAVSGVTIKTPKPCQSVLEAML